ncbi:MAG: hypothetical protein NVSMB66_5090 [Candidatus Doudnabacteria bacterium]
MREKLRRKKYPENEIESAIQRLTELKYLDDDQYAQIYLDNLKKYKNFGYFGIKKKLKEKKILDKAIEALLKDFSLKEETEIAKRLIFKNPRKSREQMVRALQSKGFRSDVIFKATKVITETPFGVVEEE